MSEEQINVDQLAKRVEQAWRRSRPRLMRLYDESGQTAFRIREAAQSWYATSQDLQRQGIPFDQADGLARYEWVSLPDISEAEAVVAQGELGD